MIEASWPGQPFLDRTINKGDLLLVAGTVRFFHGRQLQPREFINLGGEETDDDKGRVLAVYPATEGCRSRSFGRFSRRTSIRCWRWSRSIYPSRCWRKSTFPSIEEALRLVHRPKSVAEAMRGRSRLAFEELFFVHLLQQRANALARETRRGIKFENKRDLTSRLKASLPWQLTGAQVRVDSRDHRPT